jgi:valyl-tRNA synthetase/glutamate dehydrogenase/leucine dehydrogenase
MTKGLQTSADDDRRRLARDVRTSSVHSFAASLADHDIRRAFIIYENGEFRLSHPRVLAPLQAFLELSHDFANHEAIFIGREEGIPTPFFAFVHDTRRGLAQGGLRFRRYPNMAELLVDGLRLARGMTRKNALAGLWWGGGKGIMPLPPAFDRPEHVPFDEARAELFKAYGRFVASLGGVYYAAEDVGTATVDMNAILTQNRFITCIDSVLGGSGNPSPFTARGVFRAMQAAWLFLTGSDSLRGVRVAVQGAGNVGAPLVEHLDDAGAVVWVSDVNADALAAIRARRPNVSAAASDEIYRLPVDILAPCAIGAVINSRTIPLLNVRLVCGAANNILERPQEDAELLLARDIAFVPDYLCNRMGIVNCADEWLGYLEDDIRVAAERVYPDTLRVLRHARNSAITTTRAADELADIAASELHPLLGHRGRRIIDHLVAVDWAGASGRSAAAAPEPMFMPPVDEPLLRVEAERQGLFRGTGPAVACAPVSAASRPTLATVLSPLLMDVHARAAEILDGVRPRRVIGSDHGGLALQLAVEQTLPFERQQVGRTECVEVCRDYHGRNDAAIREQLHQAGIGFDPAEWLDPMSERGRFLVKRLYSALSDAGLIARENRLEYRCPRCESVQTASEVTRDSLNLDRRYSVRFQAESGSDIVTTTFNLELLVGVAAIAVDPAGEFGTLSGQQVVDPLEPNRLLPILGVDDLDAPAEFLVPSCTKRDATIVRAFGIPTSRTVYGPDGNVSMPDGTTLPPDRARLTLVERLGTSLLQELGSWQVEVRRCGKCGSLVHPDTSSQLFVRFDDAVGRMRRAIDSGAIRISPASWEGRLLRYLDALEPWCISRQYWWGNAIPSHPEEVLSTWFSSVACALGGAGWPGNPEPAPISEVFVDPDWLFRWIVPGQLVSLSLTGRPLFSRVQVHGSVHIMERRLVNRQSDRDATLDEDRFVFRSARRQMRRTLGNVVEPTSLIRRFGADALRLGCLLCLSATADQVMLTEGRLKHARSSLRTLLGKVCGLFATPATPLVQVLPRPLDECLVARCVLAGQRAREAYGVRRFRDAAEHFVDAVNVVRRYINIVMRHPVDRTRIPAARAAIALTLRVIHSGFNPICPYVLDKLARWAEERCPEVERAWRPQPWAERLCAALPLKTGLRAVVNNADLAERLRDSVAELQEFTGVQITFEGSEVEAGKDVVLIV